MPNVVDGSRGHTRRATRSPGSLCCGAAWTSSRPPMSSASRAAPMSSVSRGHARGLQRGIVLDGAASPRWWVTELAALYPVPQDFLVLFEQKWN
jgi:hypothetical protein